MTGPTDEPVPAADPPDVVWFPAGIDAAPAVGRHVAETLVAWGAAEAAPVDATPVTTDPTDSSVRDGGRRHAELTVCQHDDGFTVSVGAAPLDDRPDPATAELLLALTEDLSTAVTAAAVAEVVTTRLREHLGAVFHGIALIDTDSLTSSEPTMRYLDLSVFPPQTARRWSRFPLSADIPVAAVARSGTAAFTSTRAAAEARHPGIAEHMRLAGTSAMAHLPLLADGVCLGTLALAWRDPRAFDDDTRRLLAIVAGYAAQALNRRDPASDAVAHARLRLADAHAEFDAALGDGADLRSLVDREAEIARAAAALDAARPERDAPPGRSGRDR